MNNPFQELVLSLPLTEEVFDKLATAENRPLLRASTALSKRQWFCLWEKNLPSDQAALMVGHDLDADQAKIVIEDERRGSVLLLLFHRPILDKDQQELVLRRAKGSTFPALVMRTDHLDPSLLSVAAERLTGVERLEWIAGNLGTFDDESAFAAVIDAVSEDISIRDMRSLNRSVGKIIATRPGLVSRLASQVPVPTQLRTALASSRHLVKESDQANLFADLEDSKFAALAFVANPVAHESLVRNLATHDSPEVRVAAKKRLEPDFHRVDTPFESVSDPSTFARLLRRCLPSTFRPEGRPVDLAALALNDLLDLDSARKVFDLLEFCDLSSAPVASVNEALSHLAKRLGIEPPPPRTEPGFWVASTSPRWPYRPLRYEWVLSPKDRPWSGVDTAALLAEYPLDFDRTLAQRTLANVVYADRVGLHLYLVHSLGLDPVRWELLLGLSKTHLGSLETLVKAARTLAR